MVSSSATAEPAPDGAEAGFLTIQFVWAVAMSLTLLVAVANLIAFQYGRGVVRAALDEGARAGSRAEAPDEACADRARSALADLLGGAMGREVRLTCTTVADRVVAQADVTFRGWLPLVPDWTFDARAVAVKERAP